MDVKEIRLECLKLALETARRSADLSGPMLVERAGVYERYVQGRAAPENQTPKRPARRGAGTE